MTVTVLIDGVEITLDAGGAPPADGGCDLCEPDGGGDGGAEATAIGDGTLLKLILEFAEKLIPILLPILIGKGAGAKKIGDGTLLKLLLPFLLQLLPIILPLLGDEDQEKLVKAMGFEEVSV